MILLVVVVVVVAELWTTVSRELLTACDQLPNRKWTVQCIEMGSQRWDVVLAAAAKTVSSSSAASPEL